MKSSHKRMQFDDQKVLNYWIIIFWVVSLNRAVFKCFLKQSSDGVQSSLRRCRGRLFHATGPQCENPLSPIVLLFVIGTMSCPAEADLRCARPGTSRTRTHRYVKYADCSCYVCCFFHIVCSSDAFNTFFISSFATFVSYYFGLLLIYLSTDLSSIMNLTCSFFSTHQTSDDPHGPVYRQGIRRTTSDQLIDALIKLVWSHSAKNIQ